MASGEASIAQAREVPVRAQGTSASFRPIHFFVLASLMAATAAVVMSRQSTPEHLILMSLTIAAAGLAAAAFYRMLSPLVGDAALLTGEALSERVRAVLTREKGLVLRSLKDLEFDRSMGKVSQSDFEEMARRLRARAVSLMKQLDEDASGYKTIIERELTARLAGRAAGGSSQVVAETSSTDVQVAPGLCACGTANDIDAVFCKRCGTKLSIA